VDKSVTRYTQDADTERTQTTSATGFRVGDCYMMTAYHVLKK